MGKRKGKVQVTNQYGTTFEREQMLGSDKDGPAAQQRQNSRDSQASAVAAMDAASSFGALAADSTADDLISAAIPDAQWQEPDFKRVSTSTPWGKADYSYNFGRGVTQYITPSHGGYIVAKGTAAKMPEALRETGDKESNGSYSVSYTHLTLPTIYSV